MAKAGRPTKYTPETVARLVEGISLGLKKQTHIAAYADISDETYHTWLNGKPDFLAQVKKAEARRAARFLARITKATEEHWQAAAWALERLHPDEYGRTVLTNEISGPAGAPLTVILAERPDGPK